MTRAAAKKVASAEPDARDLEPLRDVPVRPSTYRPHEDLKIARALALPELPVTPAGGVARS
jgi:hypothetical protein